RTGERVMIFKLFHNLEGEF
ncbi:DUF2294 domain-containing protein, partial [Bacillus thuringiensis]